MLRISRPQKGLLICSQTVFQQDEWADETPDADPTCCPEVPLFDKQEPAMRSIKPLLESMADP
jgi:hypothetical protein